MNDVRGYEISAILADVLIDGPLIRDSLFGEGSLFRRQKYRSKQTTTDQKAIQLQEFFTHQQSSLRVTRKKMEPNATRVRPSRYGITSERRPAPARESFMVS